MSTLLRPYPIADVQLARRLESAEGRANAAFVDARAQVDASSGATWTTIAGTYAMFDGVDSPLTQTFGLGIFEQEGAAELAELERFFTSRGATVFHEVSPYIAPDLLLLLSERGYHPIEQSTVLVRPTALDSRLGTAIVVRRIGPDERELWCRLAGEGWSSESPELATFIEAFGRILTRAEGVHCFLAELDGRPIATAALTLHGDVALLAGASTIPSGRRQGAQQALLEARLHFAHEQGALHAMVVAQPGSGSQRNAERQAFRVAYTRTKWKLR
jgi:GNAT superfamily N-acetyltransferase